MLSKNYKHWISQDDPKRCIPCEEMHGKIYKFTEAPKPKPPLHPFCRCVIKIMEALKVGAIPVHKYIIAYQHSQHNSIIAMFNIR